MSAPEAPAAVEDVLVGTEVFVRFAGLVAVAGVDITVAEGEIVALIGPNGAGKTTLLNALSGVVPMTGEVTVGGVRPRSLHPRALAKLGLARSFQAPQLIEHESALENVLCGAYLRAGYGAIDQLVLRHRARRRERELTVEARSYLDQAGLSGEEMETQVSSLPHGARKRVDIVRALMSRPRVLLMDEPTSGMAEEERVIVQQLATDIRTVHGTTILMVEHHMEVVRAIADRAVALHLGKVLKHGAVDDVLGSAEMVSVSLGRDLVEEVAAELEAEHEHETDHEADHETVSDARKAV
jgi:ABC-type branched-subunit amino acid transport system ATPase component